jgi:nucleotide-binding universal stress UspA family protein
MKYEHLLVPVEQTTSERAIDAALDLAVRHGADITLIYVIEAIAESAQDTSEEFADFYAELEQRVRQRLAELARPFQQAGVSVRPEVIVGQKAHAVVQYSVTRSIDLIVMESERCDLTCPESALDSFSHQVSMFCQCPVMLLK